MTRKKGESQVGGELQLQRELYSPAFQTADPNSLCFQEWLDQEVNAERWDTEDKAPQLFEDPQTVLLPPSILGHKWKRPSQLFPQAEFMIYVDKPVYPNLIAGSQHLLDSEFVRNFISSVEILCYLGNSRKFSLEYTSSSYVANTADKPWRPWHHVYSKCRAGKGEKHSPSVNKSGKYIVRIFWMGCWRKVYVDDSLPVNTSNVLLLPSLITSTDSTPSPTPTPSTPNVISRQQSPTRKSAVKKEQSDLKKTRIRESYVIEIWPFLLAKALMKVASLTWTKDEELKDFDIIQCLTGWIPYKMYTRALHPLKVWDFCMKHTAKFQWTEDRATETKTKKAPVKLAIEDENAFKSDCYLTLCYNKTDTEKSSPHNFLVDQTRDIPLVKPSKISDFPVWKRFRWLDWAVERGIISPLESTIPIRCFKTVDPFRSVYDDTVYDNLDVILATDEESASKRKNESSQMVSVKSLAGEKSKNKVSPKSKEKAKVTSEPIPDISKWIDYEQVSEHINYVTVYYKPSKFNVKVRISNIICENIQKEIRLHPAKKLEDTLLQNWKEIIIPETLQMYRNEPYHFFRDSLNSQIIIINLTQTGHQPVLEKLNENDGSGNIEKSESECGICSSTLLQRVMNNVKKKEEKCEKVQHTVEFPLYSDHNRPEANLIVIKCRWTDERTDNIIASFSTFGSRSIVLKLKPGRELFSIFTKAETSYVTQILSDGALCVGTAEEIYPLMAEESRSLEKMAKAVAKSFETLIKSFGKPDFQAKLLEYYSSYKPYHDIDKYDLETIHETFFDELYKLVLINMGEDELRALKILFRKVQLPRGECMSDSTFCYPVHEEEMEYVEIMKKAAIVIQSFFKGCYERSLLKYHKPSNKNYKSIAACLNTIYSTLFSEKGGLNLGTTLLRNFLNNDFIYDFRDKYQCFEDNQNTITIFQFPIFLKNLQKKWAILDRQVFFVTSYTPLVIRVKMFCDLSKYVVRVFDNDTGHESKIFTNNVVVGEYAHNYNGYTMLCYGWPTSDMILFKLVFVASRGEDVNSLSFSGVPTKSEVMRGNYIPNTKRLICVYQILVKSEYVLLTVHFTTDFPEVKILLRVHHQNGTLVREGFGEGSALIPAIMLENNQEGVYKKMGYTDSIKSVSKKLSKSKMSRGTHRSRKVSVEENIQSDTYIIEAYVVNDSWPLSADEWKVVEKLREKMLVVDGETPSKGPVDTTFSSHNREFINQSPIWTMEMIYNSGDLVKFVKDEKREAEIRKTKMRWYEQDPSRYKRSQELRNDFLEKNAVPNPEFCESLTERSLRPQIFHPEVVLNYDITPFLLEPTVVKKGTERKLKTAKNLRDDSTNELNNIIEFTSYQTNSMAEMYLKLEKQVENFSLLDNWYNDCRQESHLMMESAYALKEKYVQHVSEAAATAQKAAKKGKKEKVSKKL